MNRSALRQLQRAALHEAGHVVTAAALGFMPLDASIKWDARVGGVTNFRGPGITGAAAPVVVTAGDLAADLVEHQDWPGPTAAVGPWFGQHQEARARRPPAAKARERAEAVQDARRGGYSDGDLLQRTTTRQHPVDVGAHAARSRIQARAILAERWAQVLEISNGLLEHGRVEFKNNGRTSTTGARPPAQPRVSGSPAPAQSLETGRSVPAHPSRRAGRPSGGGTGRPVNFSVDGGVPEAARPGRLPRSPVRPAISLPSMGGQVPGAVTPRGSRHTSAAWPPAEYSARNILRSP